MNEPARATGGKHSARIPLPIMLFGGLLVLIGLAAGIGQYLAPTATFAGLPALTPALANVAWQVGSRSIGQAVALAIGLFLRCPRVLGVLFVMRAVTETQDLIIALRTGSAPAPPLATIAVFVVLFIIPEILAARWLFRASKRANAR